jgi:hypothetical protein
LNSSHDDFNSLAGEVVFFQKSGDRFEVAFDFDQLAPQLFAKSSD